MSKQPAITLLIKPASGSCNLRCRYCFYADEMNIRRKRNYGMMSEEILDILVERTLNQVTCMATFAFQGGEPTLAGLDFFRKLIEIQKKHNHNRIEVHNTLQTNGIVIDEEWARFLHDNHFLVGLSLDGYEELHNDNRVFPDCSGSFARVIQTAQLFQEYKVEFNILTVVTAQSSRRIKRIYRFFQEQGYVFQTKDPVSIPLMKRREDLHIP